jgi:hypothetical protein
MAVVCTRPAPSTLFTHLPPECFALDRPGRSYPRQAGIEQDYKSEFSQEVLQDEPFHRIVKTALFSPAHPGVPTHAFLREGRSKRKGEAYSVRYVEPLSAARTKIGERCVSARRGGWVLM